jgi:GMP synthase-like glutamine amidotransferase
MKPVAIVQNDIHDGPSYFATWLQGQGIGFEVFAMFDGQPLPADLSRFSGLCMLGGPMSANDALPYYPQLMRLVRAAVQQRQPVIGHCLGGQLLSRALGGTVQASANLEIGWSQLEPVQPTATEWFGPMPAQLFQWHGESFSIPPGAIHLLVGQHCANQAYVLDDMHLGIQFHCEVDLPKLQCWLELGAGEMQRSTSPGVQRPDAIRLTLQADLERSQRTADRIYSRWAQGLQR